jgi:hypothetical protein
MSMSAWSLCHFLNLWHLLQRLLCRRLPAALLKVLESKAVSNIINIQPPVTTTKDERAGTTLGQRMLNHIKRLSSALKDSSTEPSIDLIDFNRASTAGQRMAWETYYAATKEHSKQPPAIYDERKKMSPEMYYYQNVSLIFGIIPTIILCMIGYWGVGLVFMFLFALARTHGNLLRLFGYYY